MTGLPATRIGRPKGPIAQAILNALSARGPMSAREIALDLQLSLMATRITCSRLYARDEIEVEQRQRIEGSNKPIAIYRIAPEYRPPSVPTPKPPAPQPSLFEGAHVG